MMNKGWMIVATLIVLGGCVGTDVGNPQDNADKPELLVGTNPDLETTPQGLTYRGVEIESAYVVIENVELKRDCDRESTTTTQGPFIVDLLAPAQTPIQLEAESKDDYCQMRLNFAPLKDDTAPEELSGHWLAVEGTLSDGSPVTIRATRSERIQFVGRSAPIALHSERGSGLLANLSLLTWISENLDGAGEAVSVSDDTPGPLANDLRVELKTRSRLYRDSDKNGVVDDEAPAPVALPEL